MSALPGLDRYLTPPEPDARYEMAANDERTYEIANELLADAIRCDEPELCKRIGTAKHGISVEDAEHISRLARDCWQAALEKRVNEL